MRILLFGDIPGIPQLLRHVPREHVSGLVNAVIRPQYRDALSELARELQVPLITQPKWRSDEYAQFTAAIAAQRPDLIWVNSYSMVVREDTLALTRLGGINIHGALLPDYRGCNPTQWAILNGETETGVTLHELSSGLDEGAIIDQRRVPLLFEDTWQSARNRVARATDRLIADNLPKILAGRWTARPQDGTKARYCRRRTPDDSLILWSQPVVSIYNLIRALVPPLPPAFYLDEDGRRVVMDRFLTPAEVTALKYGPEGRMGHVRTEHTRLRSLCLKDAPLLYEWFASGEWVMLNTPLFPDCEVDEKWITSLLTRRTNVVVFVVEDVKTNRAIGACLLFNIDWRHCTAELQIRIVEEGRLELGHDADAVTLLCRFGFADLNLRRIYLKVRHSDVRAIKTYQKCGFVQEGLLREAAFTDGRWVDMAIMALIHNHG